MIRSKRHTARISSLMAGMIAILVGGALPSAWSQTAVTPSIKFLSPTSFAGEMPIVTDDNNNGLNDSYRLSAWVAGAPAGSLVEFELVPGDSLTKPITIGAGDPVAGDTYEYLWDIAEGPTGVLEGKHTLKATLYDSANEELAVDTLTANILHGPTPAAADEGETPIDMTYPVSGGPLGQYTAPNGRTNSVLDSVKVGSATVEAWFTTSPPGTAPVWKICNAGETNTQSADGVRCTYTLDDPNTKEVNEAVDPSKVTAVGVIQEGGSADVVRVVPYAQDPTDFRSAVFARDDATGAIDPAKPGALSRPKDPHTGFFGCSDWVRVKVTDQAGRAVAGANVDAHAQGPSDQLKFHTSYLSVTQSAGLQPPSEGHSMPEAGTKCDRRHDTVAQQGEHGLGGLPDRKHVETTSGTRDNGTFDFALEADQPGITQLTVWLDEEDDDKFCSGEPSSAVGLGWGTEQPPASGEQPADCDLLPDPTGQEPLDGSRTASIEPTATAVKTGRSTSIIGSIEAADELCEAAQSLKLKAKNPAARRFRTISSATTDALGLASFKVQVERTKLYRVVAPAAGECALARSTIRKVRAI